MEPNVDVVTWGASQGWYVQQREQGDGGAGGEKGGYAGGRG